MLPWSASSKYSRGGPGIPVRFMRQSSASRSEQSAARKWRAIDILVCCAVAVGPALTLVIGVLHCQQGSLTVGGLLVVLATFRPSSTSRSRR